MQDFFDTSEEDLKVEERLRFQHNEIVKLQCIDHRVNAQNGSLQLKCLVLSGPHNGKKTTLFLSSNDNEVSKKIKAQFLKAFWTVDQIKTKQCKPALLVGRFFTAKSKISESKKEGQQPFQNFEEFTDAGAGDGQAQAQPQAQTAPAAQPQAVAQPAGTVASVASF